MLLPLKDDNPLRVIPFQAVTATLVVACVLVFIAQSLLGERAEQSLVLGYGFIPAVVFDHRELAPELVRIPELVTPLTSMFLHGGWMHLLGNMMFLWIFGDNIEDSMGHVRFTLFYLLCGATAAIAHGAADPHSTAPLIGASGAIAGVLGAYLMLHPRVKVLILAFYRMPLYLPAYVVLIAWFGFQIYNALVAAEGSVAWWAHIAGFLTGAVLVVPLRDRRLPLLDRGVSH
jgi:membrane associated rhomboid family serine protease